MAQFFIPKEAAEAESGGQRDDVFPEGTWEGTIEIFRSRDIYQGDGGDFFLQDKSKNYYADSTTVGSLQIGEITAVLEGQPDIGGMKYFEDNIFLGFDVNGQDIKWDGYENEEDSDLWRLSQTQLRMTKLANALGLVDTEDDGVGPVDNFHELLLNTGDEIEDPGLEGMTVRFKVVHRKFKKRDGTDGKQAMTAQFYPVG